MPSQRFNPARPRPANFLKNSYITSTGSVSALLFSTGGRNARRPRWRRVRRRLILNPSPPYPLTSEERPDQARDSLNGSARTCSPRSANADWHTRLHPPVHRQGLLLGIDHPVIRHLMLVVDPFFLDEVAALVRGQESREPSRGAPSPGYLAGALERAPRRQPATSGRKLFAGSKNTIDLGTGPPSAGQRPTGRR